MADLLRVVPKADATDLRTMLSGGAYNPKLFEDIFPSAVINHMTEKPITSALLATLWPYFLNLDWEKVSYDKLQKVKDFTELRTDDKNKTFFKKNYHWPSNNPAPQTILICGGKAVKKDKSLEFDGLREFINALHSLYVTHQPMSQLSMSPSASSSNESSSSSSSDRRSSVLPTTPHVDMINNLEPIIEENDVEIVENINLNDYQNFMGTKYWDMTLQHVLQSTTLDNIQVSTLDLEDAKKLLSKMHLELKTLQSQVEIQNQKRSPQQRLSDFLAHLTLPKLLLFR